jgi:hypothetical protein
VAFARPPLFSSEEVLGWPAQSARPAPQRPLLGARIASSYGYLNSPMAQMVDRCKRFGDANSTLHGVVLILGHGCQVDFF